MELLKKFKSMVILLLISFEDRWRRGFAPTTKNCFDRNWHLSW